MPDTRVAISTVSATAAAAVATTTAVAITMARKIAVGAPV